MPVLLDLGYENVKDGESPIYTQDSSKPRYANSMSQLAQSFGSNLDSDTVDGIEAVTAKVGGPNKLVATGSSGYLPYGILPPSGVTTGGGAPIPPPQVSVILISADFTSYAVLTIDVDGSPILNATTTIPSQIQYLTNGTTTYWITFDKVDEVLRLKPASSTTAQTSFVIADSSLKLWSFSVDFDGVARTTNIGSV